MAQAAKYDPDNAHAMIYMWGTTGLAYNVDKVKQRLPDAPLDSRKLLFDPAVAQKWTAASWSSFWPTTSPERPGIHR